jgi:hypothetical protein
MGRILGLPQPTEKLFFHLPGGVIPGDALTQSKPGAR